MSYDMVCYTKIQIVQLAARFHNMFPGAVTSSKKGVLLGFYTISTRNRVQYFLGEHQVVCGFHFTFFFS